MLRMFVIRIIKRDTDTRTVSLTDLKLQKKKAQLSRVLKPLRKNSFMTLTPFEILCEHNSTINLNLQVLFLKKHKRCMN